METIWPSDAMSPVWSYVPGSKTLKRRTLMGQQWQGFVWGMQRNVPHFLCPGVLHRWSGLQLAELCRHVLTLFVRNGISKSHNKEPLLSRSFPIFNMSEMPSSSCITVTSHHMFPPQVSVLHILFCMSYIPWRLMLAAEVSPQSLTSRPIR